MRKNRKLLILWPNLIPYSKLREYVDTVLLLTSTPLLLFTYRPWPADDSSYFPSPVKSGHARLLLAWIEKKNQRERIRFQLMKRRMGRTAVKKTPTGISFFF